MELRTPDPDPLNVDHAITEMETALMADADGYTDRVRALEATVAEADRIRDLPTVKVLARQQELAEVAALDAHTTRDHLRRLHSAGVRERATLEAKAERAAARRRLTDNPHVRALRLARLRRARVTLLWLVLSGAMAVTAVNVQKFVAGTAPAWSPAWIVGWLVDPALSTLVVSLLLTRGDLAGRDTLAGRAKRLVTGVEVGALLACLLMNVSPEISAHGRWESVTWHAIIPLTAVAAVLMIPHSQRRYADAITALVATVAYPPPTPAAYRDNGTADDRVGGPRVGHSVEELADRARALIAAGQLPPGPSATRLRTVLGCGTDTAREVRDLLAGPVSPLDPQ
jgi:hypothetical protein